MCEIDGPFRNKVSNLESMMQKLPQADIPVSHVFCNGMYARTITIKSGTMLIGAIHLHEQLNIVNGDITIVTENGEHRYTGTHVISSPSGTKRAGYAHADTTWTTILKTKQTNVQEIEAELTTNRFDDPRLLECQPLEMIGE